VTGVLFACMVADAERRTALDRWYDHDHLPSRLALPGFWRATRYRDLSEAPRRATACIYDLVSADVLESPSYLELQANTAEDTARHLRGVELHRLVGHSESPAPPEPAPVLLASIELVPEVSMREFPQTPDAPGSRTYASEWHGAPCRILLHDLQARPDDPSAFLSERVARWWLFERSEVRCGVHTKGASCEV
jgi:hypothetical protein